MDFVAAFEKQSTMLLTFHITTPDDPVHARGVDGYGGEGIVWPLLWACEALTRVNQWHLRHGRYPSLYSSGIRYRLDPPRVGEQWTDIPATLALGYGDCKKLAAWRCAELRHQGIAARPYVDWRYVDMKRLPRDVLYHMGLVDRRGKTIDSALRKIKSDEVLLLHILVQYPDETIECPSTILGMNPPWEDDGERHLRQ